MSSKKGPTRRRDLRRSIPRCVCFFLDMHYIGDIIGNMLKNRQETKIYFDAKLGAWLKREAARRICCVSQVVRNLIVDEIERREKQVCKK